MAKINLNSYVKQMEENRARYLDQTSFEECIQLREVGLFLAGNEFDTYQSVIDAVSQKFDVDSSTSETLVIQYNSLIEVRKDRIGGIAVEVGVKYFSGDSINKITEEAKYSPGEIRRNIRIFVSQAEERAIRPFEARTKYPDSDFLAKDYYREVSEHLSNFSFEGLLDDIPEIDREEYPFSWLQFLTTQPYYDIHEIYEEQGEERVREFLADFLEQKDLDGYVEDTTLFQGEREALYYDAVEAYREGKYSLSIPLALTQIDGLVIELATELGIWELDNDVTGVKIIHKSTVDQSKKYIDEVDDFLADRYKRLMGRGTRRAKILHGIETDFADDRKFAAELIWFWISVFYLVDRIKSQNSVSESRVLKFLAVSDPQPIENVAERFDSQPLYLETYLDSLCSRGDLEKEDGKYKITALLKSLESYRFVR